MRRHAFTLIELLVVVAIIVALLAILMPAMHRAIYASQVAVCVSNAHQHGLAAVNLAADNAGQFPVHYSRAPERFRSNGQANSVWHRLRTGGYLFDGKVTICPIIADGWGSGGMYADPDAGNSSYGGWHTGAANIMTAYMWTAHFIPSNNGTTQTGSVTYLDNEPAWPRRASDMRPGAALITHRVTDGGVPNYSTHDLGHLGRGLSLAEPMLPLVTPEMPVVFTDLSALSRPRDQIKARAQINGTDVGVVYY